MPTTRLCTDVVHAGQHKAVARRALRCPRAVRALVRPTLPLACAEQRGLKLGASDAYDETSITLRNFIGEVHRLLRAARYEVLPTPTIEEKILAFVPTSVTITVTASPSKPLEATIDLAERLSGHGYAVVPHLAARMISGRTELVEMVDRLKCLGVDTVFVPAGDAAIPAGDYAGSLDLLEDLALLGNPFPRVGVTGYPETHPAIHDDVTVQSMWDKRRYSTHLVSNMTFDADVLATWVRRVRARGITQPLLVGVPGPVDATKLMSMGRRIGVGDSLRFLTKQRRILTRIATPGYTPEKFLQRFAGTSRRPEMAVDGLHIFTFNQVAETEEWRQTLLRR